MKNPYPRHKRLNRKARLNAAQHWLLQYSGKNIVKGYSRHFGVDKLCAALELKRLGYDIPSSYIEQLKMDSLRRQRLAKQRRLKREQDEQADRYFFHEYVYGENDLGGYDFEEYDMEGDLQEDDTDTSDMIPF